MRSQILGNLAALAKSLVKKDHAAERHKAAERFRIKYASFQDLLESNSDLLSLIAEIEAKLAGRTIYGMAFVRSVSSRAVFHSMRMLAAFERLSGRSLPDLSRLVGAVQEGVKAIAEGRTEASGGEIVLPFDRVAKDMVDLVGGKSANLGEITSKAKLPAPRGFAITTAAFARVMAEGGLAEEIGKRKMELDPEDASSIQEASEDIQRLILTAPVPVEVARAVTGAFAELAGKAGRGPDSLRVSVRSSAIGEDSELSHAGQYLTILNVGQDKLLDSYKYVLASLYTPRAIAYRLLKGVPDDATAMGVACLEMVEAAAAGVMYTRHPFEVVRDEVVINAVFGLGPYAVDGVVEPDTYVLTKPCLEVARTAVAVKPVRLVSNPLGGLTEQAVPEADQGRACLDDAQIKQLAGYGIALEAHYGCPQDVEWALDGESRLLLLQTRPLAIAQGRVGAGKSPAIAGCAVLIEAGDVAQPGTGAGPAVFVKTDADIENFPEGGVLVAEQSSPKFMLAMNKAAAIVTAHGSVTGHMASLAREFEVPSLLGVGKAVGAITPGQEITVDAYSGRVYAGRVEQLVALAPVKHALMQGTKVHEKLAEAARFIVPLNLTDPKSPSFSPANCRTIHDMMRYLHEMCYAEMFALSDMASSQEGGAVRLRAVTGLDLHIIDMGGGLAGEHAGGTFVAPGDVVSAPMAALLKGLVLSEDQLSTPRPVQLSGLFAVMGQQMLGQTGPQGERFGDKSYAIVSDKYVNFSSRVGYHYGVLDAYCGNTVNKNYITFSFKGGAADDARRARRARAIGLILDAMGFAVEASGDRVSGRFAKADLQTIKAKLADIGRLLQFTRQTDMLMTSEESVAAMVSSFLNGDQVFHGLPQALDKVG